MLVMHGNDHQELGIALSHIKSAARRLNGSNGLEAQRGAQRTETSERIVALMFCLCIPLCLVALFGGYLNYALGITGFLLVAFFAAKMVRHRTLQKKRAEDVRRMASKNTIDERTVGKDA
ncbi:MAG: hypothetical protein ABJO05_09975 [Roseibium sp.]